MKVYSKIKSPIFEIKFITSVFTLSIFAEREADPLNYFPNLIL